MEERVLMQEFLASNLCSKYFQNIQFQVLGLTTNLTIPLQIQMLQNK